MHITGATGIVVVAPSAANVIGFFQNGKGIDAGFFQGDGHAEAGKTGANDNNLVIRANRGHLYNTKLDNVCCQLYNLTMAHVNILDDEKERFLQK